MNQVFYAFKEYLSGGMALFNTFEEADNFRRKMDIFLLQNVGDVLLDSEYTIKKVVVNPDFKAWLDGEYDDD